MRKWKYDFFYYGNTELPLHLLTPLSKQWPPFLTEKLLLHKSILFVIILQLPFKNTLPNNTPTLFLVYYQESCVLMFLLLFICKYSCYQFTFRRTYNADVGVFGIVSW